MMLGSLVLDLKQLDLEALHCSERFCYHRICYLCISTGPLASIRENDILGIGTERVKVLNVDTEFLELEP